jgi:hypothetical protein
MVEFEENMNKTKNSVESSSEKIKKINLLNVESKEIKIEENKTSLVKLIEDDSINSNMIIISIEDCNCEGCEDCDNP